MPLSPHCNICDKRCCKSRKGATISPVDRYIQYHKNKGHLKKEGIGVRMKIVDGQCIALGADGKCEHYEHRPVACKDYPFDVTPRGTLYLSLACPAVMTIIARDPSILIQKPGKGFFIPVEKVKEIPELKDLLEQARKNLIALAKIQAKGRVNTSEIPARVDRHAIGNEIEINAPYWRLEQINHELRILAEEKKVLDKLKEIGLLK